MKRKPAKKLDFDKTIKKVENVSNKVDIIMRNRLIIAFFLIVDGITFLLNPDTTLAGMAKNIILLMLLASFSILIANLSVKTKDAKTIIISILIMLIGAFFYFYPDLIAAYMQLLLSLFIIYEGITNIACILNFDNKLSKYTQAITKIYNKLIRRKNKKKNKQKAKFKDIDNSINNGLEEQGQKMMTPLRNLANKSSKSSILYIIVNTISIILGIVLLVFPDVSMMIWGIIFLYVGLSNFTVAVKAMNFSKK